MLLPLVTMSTDNINSIYQSFRRPRLYKESSPTSFKPKSLRKQNGSSTPIPIYEPVPGPSNLPDSVSLYNTPAFSLPRSISRARDSSSRTRDLDPSGSYDTPRSAEKKHDSIYDSCPAHRHHSEPPFGSADIYNTSITSYDTPDSAQVKVHYKCSGILPRPFDSFRKREASPTGLRPHTSWISLEKHKEKDPETVHVGSLILGRASVNQYPTRYFLDRQRSHKHVWWQMVLECCPCLDCVYIGEVGADISPGAKIGLKKYVEDVEKSAYRSKKLESMDKSPVSKIMTSGSVLWFVLTSVFLVCAVKPLVNADTKIIALLTLLEIILAITGVCLKLWQVLVLYWDEKYIRLTLEVTAWEDGQVTDGRQVSLTACFIAYITLQVATLCVIIIGSIVLCAMTLASWTIFTTLLPLFIMNQIPSACFQRHIITWNSRCEQDQLRLTLCEASDLLAEASSKIKDLNFTNQIFKFRQAATAAFQLDTAKLSYIRKGHVENC